MGPDLIPPLTAARKGELEWNTYSQGIAMHKPSTRRQVKEKAFSKARALITKQFLSAPIGRDMRKAHHRCESKVKCGVLVIYSYFLFL